MLMIFMLLVIGLCAIVLEVVLPFGISAIIGAALIILSGWLAINELGPTMGLAYCVLVLAISVYVMRMVLKAGAKAMVLMPPDSKSAGKSAEELQPDPKAGDIVTVAQVLRPTGSVEFHGRRFPARMVFIEQVVMPGESVRVRGRDSTFFLVEQIEPPAEETTQEAAPVEDPAAQAEPAEGQGSADEIPEPPTAESTPDPTDPPRTES